MKNFIHIFAVLITISFGLTMSQLHAQCTDILDGPFIDFNTAFGGAPCNDGNGCATNEITDFQTWAAESYIIDNFVEGGEYVFSICNGSGAFTWVPDFTIVAPSGAIDAFGAGDGDSCSITWTASESGSYTIIINEANNCGGGNNTMTDNGFPSIACVGDIACPDEVPCSAGTMTSTGAVSVCGPGATFDTEVLGSSAPAGFGFVYFLSNSQGGTGGLDGNFFFPADTIETFDSDLSGLLSYNQLPILDGTWVFFGGISDADGNFCDATLDSLIVTFSEELPPVIDEIAVEGSDQLTVNASGGATPYTFLWDDPLAQTTQTATNLEPGTYSVTVTDTNGCFDVSEITLMTSSVNTISTLNDFSIAPNPTSGNFSVDLSFDSSNLIEINIVNMMGNVIQEASQRSNAAKFNFDLQDAPYGIYFVNITVDQETMTQRIVITE